MPGSVVQTLGALVRRGERMFRRAGLAYGHALADARDEALWLTLHALKLPGDTVPLQRKVSAQDAARVLALFRERVQSRKPAAYLTREAWLGGRRFYVDERVLVPRSYLAELLLGDGLPYLPPPARVKHALDLCTGSGCLAVLLAQHHRQAQVDASDVSLDALDVARINLRRHRLLRRVTCIASDYFAALRGRRYDLIVSNPPYVTRAAMRRLPPEYRAEPALALAAGTDGLDALRVILRTASRHLTPGGVLMVECGHARRRVEQTWPRLPFFWPETRGGDDCVFILTREQLRAGAAAAARQPSRRHPHA